MNFRFMHETLSWAHGWVDAMKKWKSHFWAILLALFILPPSFYDSYFSGIDFCWVEAINLAIKNHLVFGRDFVFTYGPLGYFSTRFVQYVQPAFLLFADLFLITGYGYFFYKFITKFKGMLPLLVCAGFYFKFCPYSVSNFLIFIFFVQAILQGIE